MEENLLIKDNSNKVSAMNGDYRSLLREYLQNFVLIPTLVNIHEHLNRNFNSNSK